MFQILYKYRHCLSLILFAFGGTNLLFSQDIVKKDSVIVCGKIEHADSATSLTFRFYKDYLTFDEINYTTSLEDDSFYLKIPINSQTPGFIAIEPINVPIFLQKGDSLNINASIKDFAGTLNFGGKGALRNNYLRQSFVKFDRNDASRVEAGIQQNTAEGFQKFLADYKQERQDFLDSFLLKQDTFFSASFKEYVQVDINYWWGQNLMRYRVQHPASSILPVSLSLSETYFKFMDTLDLNKEAALNNVNYINYLEQYLDWRQDRIAKGKLQFKNVAETKKELVKVKMVETFGQVLIERLGVRKEAYDPLSTFANLERGTEVLYLQDITNDRFMFPYNGKRYVDKFLKIELSDGRVGWVFKGGIHLKQKIVYTKKWVEIPDTRPELMQNFKYANFKGKVMHYAIARDLYKEVVNGTKDVALLHDYMEKAEDNAYKNILKFAVDKLVKEEKESTNIVKLKPVKTLSNDILLNKSDLLKDITKITAANLIKKQNKSRGVNLSENFEIEVINPPDFAKFSRNTQFSGTIGPKVISLPKLIVNKNPILREETEFTFPKKTNREFQFEFPLNASTSATLHFGTQKLDLMFQPGFNLNIELTGNDLFEDLAFSGKGSGINNYLLAQAKEFQKEKKELEEQIRFAGSGGFKTFVTNQKNKKLQFLRNYLQSHQLSADVIKYARADILYWYAYNLMNYPYEHPIHNNQPTPMPVPVDYYDFMVELPVNNSAAIQSKFYTYYLQDFLSFNSDMPENKGLNRIALAEKYLVGKPLYFYKALLVSNQIKRAAKNNNSADRETLDFLNNCPYDIYKEFVKLAYYENRGIIEGMMAPSFELADVNGNLVALSDYKGKVIFLDFWATWCGPCKRLEPTHKKLRDQFKGDNVAFLYVSTDKNANTWRSYLQRGTFHGMHLFANPKMVKDYKVDTLPYSLLIDTNGKIVWQHTGGFSVQKTAQKILELLQ